LRQIIPRFAAAVVFAAIKPQKSSKSMVSERDDQMGHETFFPGMKYQNTVRKNKGKDLHILLGLI
jgi:hypothetical protein